MLERQHTRTIDKRDPSLSRNLKSRLRRRQLERKVEQGHLREGPLPKQDQPSQRIAKEQRCGHQPPQAERGGQEEEITAIQK